ncbi:MAG TPA: hypothetical protein VGW76_05665 [Pyrinomonadaceae bacterium]|nr:hypothetical protein [Pyrinomonadaceae bacterium]
MRICSKLKGFPPFPWFAAIAVVLVVAGSAFGQCSMCRASLAGSNNAFFIRNFNIGVLVLLLPPVTIFCTIFVALKRYRAVDEEETTADEEDPGKDDNA